MSVLDQRVAGDEGNRQDFRWQVPEQFNIAVDVCGRWAGERSRLALYCEDAGGRRSAYTFWDIQRQANRLSNVLAALGTLPGDRVAVSLPQTMEHAVALVAICQLGALSVPLPQSLAPRVLACRLRDSGAHVLIAADESLAKVLPLRGELRSLRHIIHVGSGFAPGVRPWAAVLEHASTRYTPLRTAASDAAMIVYAERTDEQAPGMVLAQQTLLGTLSGFRCAHECFPQPADLFWSPVDWATSTGLWHVLLPTWHFGVPLLAYAGDLDAPKALALIDGYGVRNAFLPESLLRAMMHQTPAPRATHDIELRTLVSSGWPVAEDVRRWAVDKLGVRLSASFPRTGANHLLGDCAARWPVTPGALGRAYPGHHVAVIDRAGNVLPPGVVGQLAVHRQWRDEDNPVLMLGYWRQGATRSATLVADVWLPTGDWAMVDDEGVLWYQEPSAIDAGG